MFIDCSKLPDPYDPKVDDVFMSADGLHSVVMVETPSNIGNETHPYVSYFIDGIHVNCPAGQIIALLASYNARPWGRLDRSPATRPEIARDPEIVAQRLQAIGPHLRALREQYGLSMGDFSRALGCPSARLSMLELGEPDPVREGAGVREDEGRAALAELLTDTVSRALGYALGEDDGLSGLDRSRVWEALHGMLVTGPAHAAMSTILKARGAASLAENPGTSAWHQPEAQPAGVHRVGDRIRWVGRIAKVVETDPELDHVTVVFEDNGALAVVSASGAELANENVAIDAARAGLSLHLARVVAQSMDPREPAEIERSDEQRELQTTIEQALATGEAQRLIRLHG